MGKDSAWEPLMIDPTGGESKLLINLAASFRPDVAANTQAHFVDQSTGSRMGLPAGI